jgi:hypothetical protein
MKHDAVLVNLLRSAGLQDDGLGLSLTGYKFCNSNNSCIMEDVPEAAEDTSQQESTGGQHERSNYRQIGVESSGAP